MVSRVTHSAQPILRAEKFWQDDRLNRDQFPAMILVHILRDGVILVPPFPAPKISKLLHAGSVRPSDHFWHEGMANWQIVSTRWEADDGSSAAPATTTSPAWPAKASAARVA